MTALETLAVEKQGLQRRRDQALGALAERAGIDPPALRETPLTRLPAEGREQLLGHLAVEEFALEMLQMLALELDAMRAGRRGRKKGV